MTPVDPASSEKDCLVPALLSCVISIGIVALLFTIWWRW